jgi:hypothetical protein
LIYLIIAEELNLEYFYSWGIKLKRDQSIVGSVIGAELGKEDYSSITATAIGRGLEPLDVKTDSRIRLNWWWKPKIEKRSINCLKDKLYLSQNDTQDIPPESWHEIVRSCINGLLDTSSASPGNSIGSLSYSCYYRW